jgi:hypothetical protein
MSKKNRNGVQDAKALEAFEDAEVRALLAEQEARMEIRQEQDRQRAERLLAEARQQLAADRLEAEAGALALYREQAIAQAAEGVAPQFAPFIIGSTREEIDAAIERAKVATAEILTELAGTGQPATSSVASTQRDELGRFIPGEQQPAEQSAEIDWEHLSLEDWAKVRGQYIHNTDRRLFD